MAFPRDSAPSRLMVGLMTGTSLDGIDVALATLSGSGRNLGVETHHAESVPFEPRLRDRLQMAMAPELRSDAHTALDRDLGLTLARAVRRVVESAGRSVSEVDAVGSHGQTIFHAPDDGITRQIGDIQTMARDLGVTVVGDFRSADVALGGEGAPLVPWFDWCLFADDRECRALLNLGGIANLTLLPARAERDGVRAFDTGPANLVIDGSMHRLFGKTFDRDGDTAGSADPDEGLVSARLAEPFFVRKPPKSTGRELFSDAWIDAFIREGRERGLDDARIVASATSLTVRSVALALASFADTTPDRLIVSGGGVHNTTLMEGLQRVLAPIPVDSVSAFGIDPDTKEALCFAVLAHEALNGISCGMPSVTGASAPAFLGRICKAG